MDFLQMIDDTIVLWVRTHMRSEFLDGIMTWISKLGNGGILWISIGIMLLLLSIKKGKNLRKWGLLLLISLGLTAILGNLILKPFIGRIRPYEQLAFPIIINQLNDFSFPSGHTSAAFAAAWICYAMNKKWGILMLVFAVVMAFSRLYLGVHYPTDLLAGAVLGTIVSFIVLQCFQVLEQKRI